jgi:hypothetical protein
METLFLLVDPRSALRDYVMVPRELWLRVSSVPSVTALLDTDFLWRSFFFLIENIRAVPCAHLGMQPPRNARFDDFLRNHRAQGTWAEAAVELADPSWPLRFLPSTRGEAYKLLYDHELCQTERQLIIMAYGTLVNARVYDFYASTSWLRRLTLLSLILLYLKMQMPIANAVPITEHEVGRAYLRESYFSLAHETEWLLNRSHHQDHPLSYLYRLSVNVESPTARQRKDFWNNILLRCSERIAKQASLMQLDHVITEAWRFLTALLAFHRSLLHFDAVTRAWTQMWYRELAYGMHNPGNMQVLDPHFWQLLLESNTARVHRYVFFEWHTMLNPEETEDEEAP